MQVRSLFVAAHMHATLRATLQGSSSTAVLHVAKQPARFLMAPGA
jgi:hypothetical protein